MKFATSLMYCTVLGLSAVAATATAQFSSDPFGPAPNAGGQSAPTPDVEKSVLTPVASGADEGRGDLCQCAGDSASMAKIEQVLREPLKAAGLDFSETPLEDVVAQLQDEYGIPVQLDGPALEEIGTDAQEKITVSLHNISLRSALRLMLRQLQLTYIVQDEVLMITTPEQAESQLIVCVYDVRSIADPLDDQAIAQLMDAIIASTATETWAQHGGGNAQIRPLKPGLLVISQTRAVHEEIRALLSAIRDVRSRPQEQAPARNNAGASRSSADRVVM